MAGDSCGRAPSGAPSPAGTALGCGRGVRAIPAQESGVSWLLTLAAHWVAGGLLRTARPPPLRQIAVGVIELVRATPQLMVIFWIFFAVPAMTGHKLPAWTAAVVPVVDSGILPC